MRPACKECHTKRYCRYHGRTFRTPEFSSDSDSSGRYRGRYAPTYFSDSSEEDDSSDASHPFQTWNKTCCDVMATGLVHHIFRNRRTPSNRDAKAMSGELSERIWKNVCSSDISLKPSGRNIQRTITAVHEDLSKSGRLPRVRGEMEAQDPTTFQNLARNVICRLRSLPERPGCKEFLSRVRNALTWPFRTCIECLLMTHEDAYRYPEEAYWFE